MRKRRRENGYTLHEVLIALVILSVALIALIPMLIYTTRGNSFGKSTTLAATLAQDKLEELRREPIVLASGTANPLLVAGTYADPSPPAGFSRSWTIVDSGGSFSADVLGIEVTAAWTDSKGLAHTSRFFTVRTNQQ